MICCLFRYSTDAGTSSCLWSFNPLLLRLLGEISPSLPCSHSSRGSALHLDPSLCVGRLRASVPPRQNGVKGAAASGALAHSGGGREGYGGGVASLRHQRRHDVAAARGTPCVLLGKLSPDPGTLAVAGCTDSREGRCGE